jgi:hypothetical protein
MSTTITHHPNHGALKKVDEMIVSQNRRNRYLTTKYSLNSISPCDMNPKSFAASGFIRSVTILIILLIASGFAYGVRSEVNLVRCSCQSTVLPFVQPLCRHLKLFVYYLTHYPLCLLKIIGSGIFGLISSVLESSGSVLTRLFSPLIWAFTRLKRIVTAYLFVPLLAIAKIVLSPFVFFDKITSPSAFPPDTEPIGYWPGCFRCLALKIHHVFRIPFSIIESLDGAIDSGRSQASRLLGSDEGTPQDDIPPPREAEFCGTGPGKVKTEQKLDEVAYEVNATQALLSDIAPSPLPDPFAE